LIVEELQGLADPLAGVPVDWPGGGPDGPAELLGAALVTASPRTALRVLETLRMARDELPEDWGFADVYRWLGEIAIRFGADGDPETAALLLDYSADVSNWQGRWQS
jgi:hypothetical protein